MANKISNVIGAIERGLAGLVVDGRLKAVQRRIINPLTEAQLPVLGLMPSTLRRDGGPRGSRTWVCQLLLMLAVRRGAGELDERIIDAVAAVDAAVDAVADAGTSGGVIQAPTWDLWAHPVEGALQPVGAMGTLEIRVEGPLAT